MIAIWKMCDESDSLETMPTNAKKKKKNKHSANIREGFQQEHFEKCDISLTPTIVPVWLYL